MKSSNNRSSSPRRVGPLDREILARTRSKAFQTYIRTLLVELCRVDTTPNPDVRRMQAAEDRCFRILERELSPLRFCGARLERPLLNPAIQSHPNYSLPHFTKTPSRPTGLSAKETCAGRGNLLYVMPGAPGRGRGLSIALNAHVDVVAPYFPPRVIRGVVYGRGACDDKGPVVSIVAGLRILSDVLGMAGLAWNRNVTAMFVVEEETGGNGSLSLAIDRELKRLYDSVLVCECTGLNCHPANRGAVWYREELNPPAGVSPLELFAFVNEELEKEGAAIRAESRHPLFPQRPVQTCHGVIGPFGEHPSRICGRVEFFIRFERRPKQKVEALVRDCLEAGLAGYVGLYGDKSKVRDPATGKPMVPAHYTFSRYRSAYRIEVHGATGHMGAIRERDGAITKLAHIIRSLVFSKEKIQAAGGPVHFELGPGSVSRARQAADSKLVLEGGQGFVPTHGIDEVMRRLERAAQRGADCYLNLLSRPERGREVVQVTYDKLHNVAFDGDADSPTIRNARAAAAAGGLTWQEPVVGWTVSCDARLFATEYPGLPVLTFGPGLLAFAHSDQEQVALDDIRKAAEFLALFLLRQTGTAG